MIICKQNNQTAITIKYYINITNCMNAFILVYMTICTLLNEQNMR